MNVHVSDGSVNHISISAEVSSLLELGCKLFPCRPDTKRPAIVGWKQAATDDLTQISQWITQGRLLGIYCAGSGFLGVEVDIKNDPQAWEWFRGWMLKAGFKDFANPLQFSRSGAPHYAFRLPDDWDPEAHGGTRTFKISDFRAMNDGEKDAEIFSIRNRGLLIAAGSVVDGKRYELASAPVIHPWLPALGDTLGGAVTIEAPTHDSEVGLKNCTFEEVERSLDVLLPMKAFDIEKDWTQAIWRIKRSLGVEGWPLVEKISYDDEDGLRLTKWNNERPSVADPHGALSLIKEAARLLKATGSSDSIIFAAEQRYNAAVGNQKVSNAMRSIPLPPGPGMVTMTSPPLQPGQQAAAPSGGEQNSQTRRNLRSRRKSAASFAGIAPPEREWVVPNWIPTEQVTLFYGDGGTGKSLATVMLGASGAVGTLWFGQMVKKCPVEFITAEDSEGELHRRLADISRETEQPLENMRDLHVSSFADEDAIMAALSGDGQLVKTPFYDEVVQIVQESKPGLLILDTLADVFGGNEIIRAQARSFVNMLRKIAIQHHLAVVVLAHPSLDGMRSGKGTSGSSGWSNSVRSRLYLSRVYDDDGKESDTDARVLTSMKMNYGTIGNEIRLRYQRGIFVTTSSDAPAMADPMWKENRAERVFMDLLRFNIENSNFVCLAKKAGELYAPKVFRKEADRQGVTLNELEEAMTRLLKTKQIENAPYGAKSRGAFRLHIPGMSTVM